LLLTISSLTACMFLPVNGRVAQKTVDTGISVKCQQTFKFAQFVLGVLQEIGLRAGILTA